jgi:hypothetical protein
MGIKGEPWTEEQKKVCITRGIILGCIVIGSGVIGYKIGMKRMAKLAMDDVNDTLEKLFTNNRYRCLDAAGKITDSYLAFELKR